MHLHLHCFKKYNKDKRKAVILFVMEEQTLLNWMRDHNILLSKKLSNIQDTVKVESDKGETNVMMNQDPEELKWYCMKPFNKKDTVNQKTNWGETDLLMNQEPKDLKW